MDFLVANEGREINLKILKSLRKNINPVRVLEEVTEKFATIEEFETKWKKDLKRRIEEFVSDKDRVQDVSEILVADKYHSLNPVSDSKGGFYYVSDRWGTSEIYQHFQGKERKILPGFFGSRVRRLVTGRFFDRIFDFNPANNLLVFAASKNQKENIYIYNAKTEKVKKVKINLQEIRSPSISNDGKKIVFTALKDSRRNIYIYEIDAGKVRDITDDRFMEYAPVFSPDDKNILASVERNLNTDLRVIDIETGATEWLTETPYNEIHPVYGSGERIYYTADRNSVYNLYTYETGKSSPSAVTNIRGGIFYPETDLDGVILCSSDFNKSFKIAGIRRFKKSDFEQTVSYIEEPSCDTLTLKAIKTGSFRGKFSTDFFLPSFAYYSGIGFIGGGYFAASDILAHNTVSFYGWAWPGIYEVSTSYVLKKWRPDIFLNLNFNGEKYFQLNSETELDEIKARTARASLGFVYPVDSFISISSWIAAQREKEHNITTNEDSREDETGIGIGIFRNTAILEPFHAMRGSRSALSAYIARPFNEFGVSYNRYDFYYRKYYPLAHRLTWSNRLYLARVEGRDSENLNPVSVSGLTEDFPYLLRGYSSSYFQGKNTAAAGTEMRFLIFPRVNAHMYFMFPDINLYSISVNIFSDIGNAWTEKFPADTRQWGISWGAGLKFNFYLLQLVPVYLAMEFARPFDSAKWRTYVLFSAGFITW